MTRLQPLMRHRGQPLSASNPSALALGPALAVGLALALGACASSSPTRFHTLQPVPLAAPAGAYAGPPLQLRPVAVPAALDRAELLRQVAPGELTVREFDHWAAPLAQLARQALSEDLALRLPPGKLVFPGAAWPAAGAELKVDIQSFQISGGTATMQLSWSLRTVAAAPSATAPVAAAMPPRGAQLRLQVAAGDGASATAQAFSALLAQLADRIVEGLGSGAPGV